MDLNHRSSGHEPDEITKLLHSATGISRVGLKMTGSKPVVLPITPYPFGYFCIKYKIPIAGFEPATFI